MGWTWPINLGWIRVSHCYLHDGGYVWRSGRQWSGDGCRQHRWPPVVVSQGCSSPHQRSRCNSLQVPPPEQSPGWLVSPRSLRLGPGGFTNVKICCLPRWLKKYFASIKFPKQIIFYNLRAVNAPITQVFSYSCDEALIITCLYNWHAYTAEPAMPFEQHSAILKESNLGTQCVYSILKIQQQ